MAGKQSAFRARLFRAVHAEAAKRGIDHDALRDMAHRNFGVQHSLSELSDDALFKIYRGWTNKSLKRRRHEAGKAPIDKHEGFQVLNKLQMVSDEDLVILGQEFALGGFSPEAQTNFVRRQLRGRETIRTRGDWSKVVNGVRAINKRKRAVA